MMTPIVTLLIVASGVLVVLGVVDVIDRIKKRKKDKSALD